MGGQAAPGVSNVVFSGCYFEAATVKVQHMVRSAARHVTFVDCFMSAYWDHSGEVYDPNQFALYIEDGAGPHYLWGTPCVKILGVARPGVPIATRHPDRQDQNDSLPPRLHPGEQRAKEEPTHLHVVKKPNRPPISPARPAWRPLRLCVGSPSSSSEAQQPRDPHLGLPFGAIGLDLATSSGTSIPRTNSVRRSLSSCSATARDSPTNEASTFTSMRPMR
jgi:hypothetical protein